MRKMASPRKTDKKPGTAKAAKAVKVKFAIYIQNQGDGSASALFFKNEKQAERFAERDGERLLPPAAGQYEEECPWQEKIGAFRATQRGAIS